MIIKKTTASIGLALIFCVGSCSAKTFIPNKSSINYKLGGASGLLVPAIADAKVWKLGGSASGSLFLSCSSFNPQVTIKNSLDNIKDSFSGIKTEAVEEATIAVKGYALAKLQQSMPGLFDAVRDQSIFAGNEFKVKRASCEKIQKQVADGGSPFDGLIELSDSEGWIDAARQAKNGQEVDVVSAEKKITQNRETLGLPWLHKDNEYSGGVNQKPIKVVEDVVIAGFNLLAHPDGNVELDSDTVISSTNTHVNFARFWIKPSDAAKWAKVVLGDLSFSKDPNQRQTEPGIGLAAVLQTCPHITENGNTCPKNVGRYLWKLVRASTTSPEDLQQISNESLVVTAEIISTIQSIPREEQIIVVSKLAEDIAVHNLLEEAFSLRRILLAGYQIHEVQNLKPIRQMVKSTIELLDKEVASLTFENNVRAKMANKTLQTIMEIRQDALAKSTPDKVKQGEYIDNGALYVSSSGKGDS